MSNRQPTRFPKRVLKRYAEILLRHIHQCGGRDRYVPVVEIEDALGLEEDLILELCRTRLLGEIHVADRLPAELEDDTEFDKVRREWLRQCLATPHVRVRPGCVRLTEEELIHGKRKAR